MITAPISQRVYISLACEVDTAYTATRWLRLPTRCSRPNAFAVMRQTFCRYCAPVTNILPHNRARLVTRLLC